MLSRQVFDFNGHAGRSVEKYTPYDASAADNDYRVRQTYAWCDLNYRYYY